MSGFIDVHCHILPALDDGARDLDMARMMLRQAYEEGIRAIIATPHFREPHYKPKPEIIRERIALLLSAADDVSGEIAIYPGNEVHYTTSALEALRDKKVCAMADSFYVMTEFSPGDAYDHIKNGLYRVQMEGYTPVVAHAERYECLVKDISLIEEIVEMGCYIQINAGSITGESGWGIKRFCKKLISEDLLHLVGTDAHSTGRRRPRMKDCARVLKKYGGEAYRDQILIENPQKIIKQEYI